jgi:hypothetical protein
MITGGCQCGAVRYSFDEPLPPAYCCHCDECKKQSASAFSMSVVIELNRLSLKGNLTFRDSVSFSGKPKRACFCGLCGTRIYNQTAESGQVTLKVGALDTASQVISRGHLWVSRKQPWVILEPGVSTFDTQPDDVAAWRNTL